MDKLQTVYCHPQKVIGIGRKEQLTKKEQFIFVAEDDENQSKFNVKYMEDEKRDKLTVCKHGFSSGYNLYASTLDLKQKFKLFIYIFIRHLSL